MKDSGVLLDDAGWLCESWLKICTGNNRWVTEDAVHSVAAGESLLNLRQILAQARLLIALVISDHSDWRKWAHIRITRGKLTFLEILWLGFRLILMIRIEWEAGLLFKEHQCFYQSYFNQLNQTSLIPKPQNPKWSFLNFLTVTKFCSLWIDK